MAIRAFYNNNGTIESCFILTNSNGSIMKIDNFYINNNNTLEDGYYTVDLGTIILFHDYNTTNAEDNVESPGIEAGSQEAYVKWWRSSDGTITLEDLVNAHGGWYNESTNPNGYFWQPTSSSYLSETTPSGSPLCLYDGANIVNGQLKIQGGNFKIWGNNQAVRRIIGDVYIQLVHNDNTTERIMIGTVQGNIQNVNAITPYTISNITLENCKQINLIYGGVINNGTQGTWPKMSMTIYKPTYTIIEY